MLARYFAFPFAVCLLATPVNAAQCGGDFNRFIGEFSREAASRGIPQPVIAQAFSGVTHDPNVLAFDRRQRGTFKKTFEEYAATRVGAARVNRAKQMMKKHAALLARVEQQFGVPKELVVAIWTMETDNGADMGKLPIVRTVATLAHDCRRTDLFQRELFAALEGRFDACISVAAHESAKGAASPFEARPGAFLGFEVSDIDIIRYRRPADPGSGRAEDEHMAEARVA